ncbi:uncharacterized protein LOC135806642 isoform X2 [Sycon ciliatum]|uniref:uncharacterized protein LOC135806642 isoform X2 n=1 Tax=Sycon ciliatum TaxID=27933 RepID=UPI0020ABF750
MDSRNIEESAADGSSATTASSQSNKESESVNRPGGISHQPASKNYNPYSAGNPTDSLLGGQTTFSRRAKRRIDYEWHEIFFLVVSVLSVLVAVGFSIYRMVEEYDASAPKDKASFTFAVLIVFNAGFLLVYAIHGIIFEHVEEMIGFAVASTVVFVYVLVDYIQHHSTADKVKLARFILVVVGFPILVTLSLYCAKQFRWIKFRVAGASEEMQSIYSTFCKMESLLLFDFQIAVSLFILVLYRGASLDALETALLSVGLCYCLAWAVAGYYVTKKEYTAWTVVFEVFALLLPAYIAFKIVRIVQKWDMYIEDGIEQLAIIFYIAAGVGILVRGTLLIIVERVRKNFNKGLWRQVS